MFKTSIKSFALNFRHFYKLFRVATLTNYFRKHKYFLLSKSFDVGENFRNRNRCQ